MKTFIDLLLDNGDIVRIEVPRKWEDELREGIENTMKRRDWLCASAWEGAQFKINGVVVDRVNMGRVIAAL
jgi:hypothetical protein